MNNTLRRLDLNLLVTLDALLIEHNVTRAAERLHLSQPSVSVQLARLREFFGDPLLLPSPRGMRPTARADALREPLRLALAELAQALAPASAAPVTACRGRLRANTVIASAAIAPARSSRTSRAGRCRPTSWRCRASRVATSPTRGPPAGRPARCRARSRIPSRATGPTWTARSICSWQHAMLTSNVLYMPRHLLHMEILRLCQKWKRCPQIQNLLMQFKS